jgi:hypothetical protein
MQHSVHHDEKSNSPLMKTTHLPLIALLGLLASCKEKPVTNAEKHSQQIESVLTATPGTVLSTIHEIRASAKPGDEITLKGRIMGNSKPFVEGRAAFVLADTSILSACNDTPGDACATPWDSCCNSPEEKKKGTATIQIVGADGRVLKESMEDAGGLKKLAHVTVTGKVAPGSSPELLMVNATAVRVDP